MTGTTTLRLRRVRFKDGRTIEVLRRDDDGVGRDFSASAARVLDTDLGKQMVAYVVIAWDTNGYVYADYRNSDRSGIPAVGLPQLAKDTLIAEQAVRWARE